MSLLWRLLRLHRPHASWMALAIGLGTVTLLASVVLLALSGWFITVMALAGLAGASINYFTPAAIIRACAIARTGGRYAERVVGHEATLRFVASLRPKLFAAMTRGPLLKASGELLNRLKGDLDKLEATFLRILAPLAGAALTLAPAIGFLFWLRPAFGALVLAGVLLGGVLVPLALARRGATSARALPGLTDTLNRRLIETVEASAELAIYDRNHHHRARMLAAAEAVLAAEDSQHRLNAAGIAALQGAGFLVLAALLWLAAEIASAAALSGPDIALAAFLCLAIFDSAGLIPVAILQVPPVMEAARRLFSLLDRQWVASTQMSAQSGSLPTGGDLVLEGVHFTYPGAPSPSLTDVSLIVRKGERVALLGPSGSGKSTLAALLAGLHAPDAGTIALDGVPLPLAQSGNAAPVALLSQDAFLFSTSLRGNLLIAAPEATQTELEQACRNARILPFIERLPEGFDTFVGAHGRALSGGQARRLALARTLLRQAQVVVLDEPTEGLDAGTEAEILDALLEALEGRTLLLLTHRPARLERMDRLIFIENGKIVRISEP